MEEGIEYIITGIILGLSAGISPGPLMALLLSKTIQKNAGEGIKIAISPLITDLPIILFVLLILSQAQSHAYIISIISFLGAGYLIFLGVSNFKINNLKLNNKNKNGRNTLLQGIITNIFSPHPYLFWLSIGGPIIFKTYNIHLSITVLFFAGFYIMLIGTKIGIAILAGESKIFINDRYYVNIIKAFGIALCLIAGLLIKEGLNLLNIHIYSLVFSIFTLHS